MPEAKTTPRAPEPLWTVWHQQSGRRVDCELHYHGEHGVECVLLANGEWYYGWRFPTRELALVDADDCRARLEREGYTLLPD